VPNQQGYEDFHVQPGRWYSIEIMLKPNAMGRSFGGHVSAWIDGVLMIDYDDVSVRHANGATPLTRAWFTSYYGGGGQTTHPDQYVLYDDIVVAKSYIGPTGGSVAIDGGAEGGAPDAGPRPDGGKRDGGADAGRDDGASPSNDGNAPPRVDASQPPSSPPASPSDEGCTVSTAGSGFEGTIALPTMVAGVLLRRRTKRRGESVRARG